MDEITLRLECLKLAADQFRPNDVPNVIKIADIYLEFCLKGTEEMLGDGDEEET